MQSTQSAVSGYGAEAPRLDEFVAPPAHLRTHAAGILLRFLNAQDEWALSRAEIIAAINSPAFRPILEQEARLSTLGLASD
ncbi:hypothetical protein CRT60_06150 [Azospirillum palustre]|uniref:Uncharacterized protein n=1 Tax=Azospirillum palustre TaxID=2044885 RepID=A0A2B8BLV3_9PROT|nr:hypothetical protein [Azospirillum sp. BE72]PGH58709.1 hypothetical protein CRT60_06150 [Azospirillum palustre]